MVLLLEVAAVKAVGAAGFFAQADACLYLERLMGQH